MEISKRNTLEFNKVWLKETYEQVLLNNHYKPICWLDTHLSLIKQIKSIETRLKEQGLQDSDLDVLVEEAKAAALAKVDKGDKEVRRYTELKTYPNGYKSYVQYSVSGCYNDMNRRGDYTTGSSTDRFAELENKLEDGTLIDVRFRIGQHVFMPGFFKGEFDEYIVDNITLDQGELSFHFKHAEDAGCTCYSTTILHTEDLWKVFTSVEDFEEWTKKREEGNKDARE